MRYDTHLCWLPFLGSSVNEHAKTCFDMAQSELDAGRAGIGFIDGVDLEMAPAFGEGYEIAWANDRYIIRGGEKGALYGVYAFLMKMAAGMDVRTDMTKPRFSLRMLNHWDNMDGHVERGYAGQSLFFSEGKFSYDANRLRLYARYLASIGINTVSINNVNVHAPADRLITDLLPELSDVADLFRPFGIALLVAVDYALPVTCGLDSADPLNHYVQAWWRKQVETVYEKIPDLCGFLVKADSEFRPGPYMYGRDHAQGAHVLAQALKPFGGVVIWRCFVYNCRQDWRDKSTDRPMAAYDTYMPLEGQFDDNVILQIKNGPFDFQVREPNSPLLYHMPKTTKALEVQLAQEYTGHQIDLYYMGTQWAEIMADLEGNFRDKKIDHICAVTNLGNDENWTGHVLAQANLFAYGHLAWTGNANAQAIAQWWTKLTYGMDEQVNETITTMLMDSREIYESYTSPLGLCWMVTPHLHYGPSPEGYEYSAWGTYLRANREGVGIDRTQNGTGYVSQYPPEIALRYADLKTCPDKLLLFFHRVRYDYVMRDGRKLIERIYDDHFEGAKRAEGLLTRWLSLEGRIPTASFENGRERFNRQLHNAKEWRDVINTYFFRYSGMEDPKGRNIIT